MLKIIGKNGKRIVFPREQHEEAYFYKYDIPRRAIEIQRKLEFSFDRIIVDEAQDLITKEYLDFFNSCLKRGIQRGKWSFFGDFSRQAIYIDAEKNQFIDMLDERTSFIQFKLSTNCRNTDYICREIKTVTDFSDEILYKGEVNGPPVEYIPYMSLEDEVDKLIEILKKLEKNNVDPRTGNYLVAEKTRKFGCKLSEKYMHFRLYNSIY